GAGRCTFDWTTKVALGRTYETVAVAGGQSFVIGTPAGMTMGSYPFGLLTQPSNIGRRTHNDFAVVPEVGFNVGYQLTQHLKLFCGYNFLYWSRVVRAADQIDTVLDVETRPNPATGSPPFPIGPRQGMVQTRPVVPFRETDLWAQGINFGLQFPW